MRYYSIVLTSPDGKTTKQWTSYPSAKGSSPTGGFDPGALNVAFDLPMAPYNTVIGNKAITIEGVSLDDLYQAKQLTGWSVELSGGMGAGLPLAKPSQAGILMVGTVFQAYGNWQGTDMVLELIVTPSPYQHGSGKSFVFGWPAGTSLKTALSNLFATYFKEYTPQIKIGDYVLNHDEFGIYGSLEALARSVYDWTQQQVKIAIIGSRIVAYDGTEPPPTVQIEFTDLIGQPVWIEPYTMQIKCVMRADINLDSVIEMPQSLGGTKVQSIPGLAIQSEKAAPSLIKYKSAFQHKFNVTAVRHIGEFRSPESVDWITIISAVESGHA